jgi:hypothetical protein
MILSNVVRLSLAIQHQFLHLVPLCFHLTLDCRVEHFFSDLLQAPSVLEGIVNEHLDVEQHSRVRTLVVFLAKINVC